MVGNAVLLLLSSIVGGVLVLAGQTLARRHEDRRLWLTRLYEAAGDLATSSLQEAARVNDSRRSARVAKDEVDTSTYRRPTEGAGPLPHPPLGVHGRGRTAGHGSGYPGRLGNVGRPGRGVPTRLRRRPDCC